MSAAPQHTEDSQRRDGVLIHITHGADDPHRVAMALRMATMMAEDHDVLVYCDIKGVEVVLMGSDDITHPGFPSARVSLAVLLEKKVPVCACPGCLNAVGKTQEHLLSGVVLAERAQFTKFTKGRILTFDY
jgi:predicted peroxiredoxin